MAWQKFCLCSRSLVRLIKTSDSERTLPKGMIVGHAIPHHLGIVAVADQAYLSSMEQDPRKSRTEAEQFAAMQEPPPLADRPGIEGELWRKDVNLKHLLTHEREKVFRVLGKHRSMWDGHLGHAHSTSHRIYLVPGAQPIHAQPYRAKPRARGAESAEVQRMLKEGVIGPVNSD
jgi:hypothetical protein